MLQTQERYLSKTLAIAGVSPHFRSDSLSHTAAPKDSASDHLLGSCQGASCQASHRSTPHHGQTDAPHILVSNRVPQLSQQSGCPGASPACTPALSLQLLGGGFQLLGGGFQPRHPFSLDWRMSPPLGSQARPPSPLNPLFVFPFSFLNSSDPFFPIAHPPPLRSSLETFPGSP